MSRLDDELRRAFRPEEPSPDFTARVMRAVAAAPAPKRRWWDELLSILATPRGRWVTVGAAVSLLALILATQYGRLEQGPKPLEDATHVNQPVPPATAEDDRKRSAAVQDDKMTKEPGAGQHSGDLPRPRHHHRVSSKAMVAATRPDAVKSEGEIARDQLMLALHIASASLNEAQRIVRVSEGHQPHTVAR